MSIDKKSPWSKSELILFVNRFKENINGSFYERNPGSFMSGYFNEEIQEKVPAEGVVDSMRVINEIVYINQIGILLKKVSDKRYSIEFANEESVNMACNNIAIDMEEFLKEIISPMYARTKIFDGNSDINIHSPVIVYDHPLKYITGEFINSLFDIATPPSSL